MGQPSPWQGYLQDVYKRQDERAAAAATHHLLLGHGLALEALRAELGATAEVGITLNMTAVRPVNAESKAVAQEIEAETNRIFLDPVLKGAYPTGAVRAGLLPGPEVVQDGDLARISAPIDFLGINYYRPTTVGYRDLGDERRGEERIKGHPGAVSIIADGVAHSSMGWPIDASGLHELLVLLHLSLIHI